jgi:carbon-monoxide dehydrogenase large subunit
MLGLPENRIRVIAPDVGGGFGLKAVLYPEEVALCLLAMRLHRPVKWVEQRREGFVASAHARDHHTRPGRLRPGGPAARPRRPGGRNAGRVLRLPVDRGIEALMAGGLLAGPYKVAHYRCEVAAWHAHHAAGRIAASRGPPPRS